ncbi:MAG: PEP-CTERM sorting domain-containing protein [Pirellulaceae bacterium]|nr:PEP-CTERM sorting domain-containing protein [Pirellulaceae bacterium]
MICTRIGSGLILVVLAGFFVGCFSSAANAGVVTMSSDDYATLTGYVYCDLNDNLICDENEGMIPNVWIILEGVTEKGESLSRKTFTDLYGEYVFKKIPVGTYSLTQVQPIEFINGLCNPCGTVNDLAVGQAVQSGPDKANKYVDIVLSPGDVGVAYNFSEAGLKSAYLSKRDLLSRKPPVQLIPEPGSAAMMIGLLLCGGLAVKRRPRFDS